MIPRETKLPRDYEVMDAVLSRGDAGLGISVEVGKKAYIRAGAIVSEAPALEYFEIEV
ncbi:MAG: hypothetical protein WBB23_24270 [Desulforhopalus sp.]